MWPVCETRPLTIRYLAYRNHKPCRDAASSGIDRRALKATLKPMWLPLCRTSRDCPSVGHHVTLLWKTPFSFCVNCCLEPRGENSGEIHCSIPETQGKFLQATWACEMHPRLPWIRRTKCRFRRVQRILQKGWHSRVTIPGGCCLCGVTAVSTEQMENGKEPGQGKRPGECPSVRIPEHFVGKQLRGPHLWVCYSADYFLI